MQVHSRRLNKGEVLACSKATLQHAVPPEYVEWISLAGIGRHFNLESRIWRDPGIKGRVILSATVGEERGGYVLLYVIPESEWSSDLAEEFVVRVLPQVRDWLVRVNGTPETGRHAYEELVVELCAGKFFIKNLARKAVH